MYILKNAFANLHRNIGRNFLLGIILYAVITLVAISIIINSATTAIIQDYKTRIGSEVQIFTEVLQIEGEKVPPLTPEQLLSYSNSNYLQNKQLIGKVPYVPEGINVIDQEPADFGRMEGELTPRGYLIASSQSEINSQFKNGIRKVTSGTMYQGSNEIIISKELAELNSLKPGDELTLMSTSESKPMKQVYKITGIYEDFSVGGNNNPMQTSLTNKSNEIFGNFESIINSEMFKEFGTMNGLFYLKNPNDLDAFKKELTEKGLPEHYQVTTNEDAYNQIVKPVESIQTIAESIVYGALGLGSILLILLSTFAIRERKYEVGVLRAMGMKKGKIALGVLSEMVMMTAFTLCLGLGSAALSAQPLQNLLFNDQIALSQGENSASLLANLNINLTMGATIQITVIAIVLAIISSIAGILFITKYEPMKILSERN